ncbi:hypothetical protein Q3G72_005787 [Acer saccharum]|nr:hypothetical protein Q3G72_005787 [Acer saccharum]
MEHKALPGDMEQELISDISRSFPRCFEKEALPGDRSVKLLEDMSRSSFRSKSELDNLVVDMDDMDEEFDADGGFGFEMELILIESGKEIGFSNS